LIDHRLPLFIWHVELDWVSLYALAQQFSELTIIIETQTQKILYHTRPLFALMRRCRNVLLELSNFVGVRAIEYAVGEFGAERLVFGSFQPMNDPLVPMGMILDAEISPSEKAWIAGGNLRRLIEQVQP
jgi:predicted TIM-barrel fold metal-dependent hydrolase